MDSNDVEKVEELLLQYKNFTGVSENLHLQYRTWIEARVLLLKGERKESQAKIKEALEYTLCGFEQQDFTLQNHYLCHQEIKIYLMWAKLKVISNDQRGYYYLEQLLQYIEQKIQDNQYLEELYPVLVYEIAKSYVKRNELKEALELCKKGIEIQRKNERLDYLKALIELYIEIEEKLELQEKDEEIHRGYKLLQWLEQYKSDDTKIIDSITKNKNVIYRVGEVFRNLRKENDIKQEELMYYTDRKRFSMVPETVSRIENGHRNISEKTWENYLKQLKKEIKFYASRVESEDYEVQELRHELGRNIKLREPKKARDILLKLENKVEIMNTYNIQYIQMERLILDSLENKIAGRAYREALIKVLQLTVNNYDLLEKEEKIYGFLNRNEITILNNIAVSYENEQDYDNAVTWYKKLLNYFEEQYLLSGSIDYTMIFTNYVNALGSGGKFMESTKQARRGVEFSEKDKDASYIGYFLYNIAWNYWNESKRRPLSEEEK